MEIKLTSWNANSLRFVEAPVFTWEKITKVINYKVNLADKHKLIYFKTEKNPIWDLNDIWNEIPFGYLDILIQGLDASEKEICVPLHKRFYKAHGFDGKRQKPLDWASAVKKNISYLLEPARDDVKDYEKNLPRHIWSAIEDGITGQRTHLAYPALHLPKFISTFLNFANCWPTLPQANEATKQAKIMGDWLLKNRLPKDYACSLFPYSTISNGKCEGGCEGKNITFTRAARVGEAMIELNRKFSDQKYLDYAVHLANIFMQKQNDDGSWPYRVNPKSGVVVENYTCDVINVAIFFEDLHKIRPERKYLTAQDKAINWMLDNPVKTKNWKAGFEDIPPRTPFENLTHSSVNDMIRYLTLHYKEKYNYLKIAKKLNNFIEDQFIVWKEEDGIVENTGNPERYRDAYIKCPVPTVYEQYSCYYPMETHTGNWLMSLIELHRVSGEDEYLIKAIAAANSIVRAQNKRGIFSTWGYDLRFKHYLRTNNWPGCNVAASYALMGMGKYFDALY